jgi:hypothetical protein
MSREDTIEITYGIDDGYVGGDRPHHVTVYLTDLLDCETYEEVEELIEESVEEDMRQTVSTYWKRDQLDGILDRIKALRDAENAS